MSDYAELAHVDVALAAFDRTTGAVDDFVLLILRRAELAGLPITVEQIGAFLCVSEDELLDIFARLSERGFIEEDLGPTNSHASSAR